MKLRTWVWMWLILGLAVPAQALDGGVERLRETGKAFAAVARAVSPSVVFLQVEGRAPRGEVRRSPQPFGEEWPFGDDFFKRFFGDQFPGLPRTPTPGSPRPERHLVSQGSGFVFAAKSGLLSAKSYILTNHHVVEGAETIHVKLQDGRELEGRVTGRDPHSDIAVVEVEARGLLALKFGDSSQLEVGEWVVALGNPFGLSHTLTVGVVSAKGRTSLGINDYEDFIQTDAAINPGNSGGPLVNLDGEVVGINTAIFSRSGGYMGVGFAIPSNLAQAIATQLIEHGEVTRGYLGIVIQPLTPELAESFGIGSESGIVVAEVSEGSPAAAAGLRQGDVIVRLDGEPVKEVGTFRNRVSLIPPGTRAELTIVREGQRQTVKVVVGKLTEEKLAAQGAFRKADEVGLTVENLTPQLAKQFDIKVREGVVVTQVHPGSVAAMAGIEPGSVILQVNRRPVRNVAEYRQAIARTGEERRVLLLVRKDDVQRFVALSW